MPSRTFKSSPTKRKYQASEMMLPLPSFNDVNDPSSTSIRIHLDGFELLDRDLQKGLDSTLFLCYRKNPKESKPISDLRLHDYSAGDADFGSEFVKHDQSLSNLARVLVHVKRCANVEADDAKTNDAKGELQGSGPCEQTFEFKLIRVLGALWFCFFTALRLPVRVSTGRVAGNRRAALLHLPKVCPL